MTDRGTIPGHMNDPEPSDAVLSVLMRTTRRIATDRAAAGAVGEPFRIAVDQADHIRHLLGLEDTRFPDEIVERVPHIEIRRNPDLPVAGSAHWAGTTWVITLNASQTPQQQRWTLLHELKHIIDHPHRRLLYGRRVDAVGTETAERAADLFAATALMPTLAVLERWRLGDQHPDHHAAHFDVTLGAARYRLHQLGLTTSYLDHSPYLCLDQKGSAA